MIENSTFIIKHYHLLSFIIILSSNISCHNSTMYHQLLSSCLLMVAVVANKPPHKHVPRNPLHAHLHHGTGYHPTGQRNVCMLLLFLLF
jgi:hypothetical protein